MLASSPHWCGGEALAERSVSLGILLDHLKTNQAILTRATLVQKFAPDSTARRFADRDFDRIAGTPGCSAIPVAGIDRDVNDLKTVTRPVKELADKVVVHTDRCGSTTSTWARH